jgi:hypothetical protein
LHFIPVSALSVSKLLAAIGTNVAFAMVSRSTDFFEEDDMRMKLHYHRVMASCMLAGLMAAGVAHAAPVDTELVALVQRYANAQSNFDQAAIRAATDEQFVEISPVGEVDSREKVLSFYAPDQKRPGPQLQIDEPAVRIFGDTAVVSARLNYSMNQGGQARNFALRAGYVARLVNQQWVLVSAQYTGIRPPKS